MANREKPGGRVTPKGQAKGPAKGQAKPATSSSGRYTPPIPRSAKVSPIWVPILMFTFLGLGLLMILANYVNLLPGGTNNWYLVGGLGLITAGFLTATRYH